MEYQVHVEVHDTLMRRFRAIYDHKPKNRVNPKCGRQGIGTVQTSGRVFPVQPMPGSYLNRGRSDVEGEYCVIYWIYLTP